MSFSALATAACGKWSSGNQGLTFEIPFTFVVIYAFSLYQERKVFHLPFYEGFEEKFIFYRHSRVQFQQKHLVQRIVK